MRYTGMVVARNGRPGMSRALRTPKQPPQEARDKLEFVWLESVDDAVREAIGESPSTAAAA